MDQSSFNTAKELQKTLGEQLRSLRVSKHLTQQETAAKAGAGLRAVRNLESGRGSTVETFLRVLVALNATGLISQIAPETTISPIHLFRAATPPKRVRHSKRP